MNNIHPRSNFIFVEVAVSAALAVLFIFLFSTQTRLQDIVNVWVGRAGESVRETNFARSEIYSNAFAAFIAPSARAHSFASLAPAEREPVKIDDESLPDDRLQAVSAVVIDGATGAILFDKKMHKRWPIASITKLATAAALLDYIEQHPNAKRPVTVHSDDMRDGKNFVEPGETVAWDDAFSALLVGSSNTMAVGLVRSLGITEEEWQQFMNEKIISWGLQKTQVREPSGISPGNISTAYEVAHMFQRALQYRPVYEALRTPRFQLPVAVDDRSNGVRRDVRVVDTTNWFLSGALQTVYNPLPITKTGYIPESLYNVAGLFERDGRQVIVVILGSESHYSRFTDAETAATWVFNHYRWGEDSDAWGG